MDNLNFTSTKLGRKNIVWFCILSSFFLTVASFFIEMNLFRENSLGGYLFFCTAIVMSILGTKVNDAYQKRVIKEKEKND